jgi:hypothetical protein
LSTANLARQTSCVSACLGKLFRSVYILYEIILYEALLL